MKCAKLMTALVSASCLLAGCASGPADDKIQIEIVSYKPEAAKVFEEIQDLFNETHDDIHLTINSPNEAMTILKTRFVREDYPDIVAIGGDINYSGFLDAGLFENLEGQPFLDKVKEGYRTIDKQLEFVPLEGDYAVPYVANAAGILYNRELFEEHGWKVPETWEEFTALCETIAKAGVQPLYAGYKDTWTTLAPWNAMAVELAPSDTAKQVNRGGTTFTDEYRELSEKYLSLLPYGPEDPFAYNYNDACTAFARGEAAMYPIGSYAIPQILSVNPDLNIVSFVMPANDDAAKNTLNSGIDLQFCVMADCKNKEAAYKVLDFLLAEENLQQYIDAQIAIPCKEGNFTLSPMLDGMNQHIAEGKMTDYQDHYYPSEMAVDAQIQTFLIQKDVDAFLKKFDTDWLRYNRDIIRMVQEYEKTHGN